MKKIKRLIFVIVLLLVVALVCFYLGTQYEGPIRIGPAKITAETITAKFTEVSELVTMTYNYTSMGTFENNLMFKDWNIPLTGKSFIVSFDGIIKAGINLSEVKVETDGYDITVTIPDAVILSHEIDQNSVQVLDEKTNLFNPIGVEDVTGFEEEQKQINEENAINNGLLEQAKESAQEALTELLLSIDGLKNYTITYK